MEAIGFGPRLRIRDFVERTPPAGLSGAPVYVLIVLAGLIIVWGNNENSNLTSGSRVSIYQEMAKLGQLFFYTMAGIQISLVMLVAPAATAGSICMDRARGTLVHMLPHSRDCLLCGRLHGLVRTTCQSGSPHRNPRAQIRSSRRAQCDCVFPDRDWLDDLVESLFRPILLGQSPDLDNRYRWLQICVMSFSPVFGPFVPIAVLEQYSSESRTMIWTGVGIVILTKAAITGVVALVDDQDIRPPYGPDL